MNSSTNTQFSPLTIEITNLLSKNDKKNQGIFITPRTIIEKLVQEVTTYTEQKQLQIQQILEPSCGTCEIVSILNNSFNNTSITGIELNSMIFEKIKDIDFGVCNSIELIKADFTTYSTENKYDLIVANPPYVVCEKSKVPNNYKALCIGRPNLFCIFIIHSLYLLNENGVAAFIIPKSFLNSHYYSLVRNYIKSCCSIVKIMDFDNEFIDTDQSTMGIILHKRIDDTTSTPSISTSLLCDYSIKLNDNFIFTTNKQQLEELFAGSTTLEKMGLSVKTGNIVWNEKKDILTSDTSKTLLLYNSNITKDNTVKIMEFKNNEKKQYIDIEGSVEPVIVVNRGNGNAAYKLNYALINMNTPFICENHLNVIYSKTIKDKKVMLKTYNTIVESFKNPKTLLFIKLFCGNNALSKTELESIFPIYID